jgi:hypothetical protein
MVSVATPAPMPQLLLLATPPPAAAAAAAAEAACQHPLLHLLLQPLPDLLHHQLRRGQPPPAPCQHHPTAVPDCCPSLPAAVVSPRPAGGAGGEAQVQPQRGPLLLPLPLQPRPPPPPPLLLLLLS